MAQILFDGSTNHQDYCVINVGSKERNNEETTGSFDNDVSFEVDDWKVIEECALGLGGLNLEDELHQDDQKTAAIPTKIHQSHNLQ